MPLRDELQVKVGLTDLHGKVLDTFLLEELRPEICVEGPELRYFDRDACRRLANVFRFKQLPATFHGPFMRLDPGSADKPQRDYAKMYFERTVRVAEYFQPLTIVCHAGPLYELDTPGLVAWAERSMPVWEWMDEACHSIGATLTLENILHPEPAALSPYFASLPHARWCFDVGHMHAFSKVPQTAWLETLGPHLGQLHLHDNFGGGDQHLPAGHGSIDYRSLMRGLAAREQPLASTVETHWGHEFHASAEFLATVWPWQY